MLRLLPKVEELQKKGALRIVLGSKSPRRKELLTGNVLGGKVLVEVVPSSFKEDYDKTLYKHRADEYVREYAIQKAADVENQVLSSTQVGPDEQVLVLLIGCDTVVVQDGDIFEKPESRDHAVEMLSTFNGKSHSVFSGLSVTLLKLEAGPKVVHREQNVVCTETKVNFAQHDKAVLEAYADSGEPFDKAGGYGIQGTGAMLVSSLDGCYFNVVGLPVHVVSQEMAKALEKHLM